MHVKVWCNVTSQLAQRYPNRPKLAVSPRQVGRQRFHFTLHRREQSFWPGKKTCPASRKFCLVNDKKLLWRRGCQYRIITLSFPGVVFQNKTNIAKVRPTGIKDESRAFILKAKPHNSSSRPDKLCLAWHCVLWLTMVTLPESKFTCPIVSTNNINVKNMLVDGKIVQSDYVLNLVQW